MTGHFGPRVKAGSETDGSTGTTTTTTVRNDTTDDGDRASAADGADATGGLDATGDLGAVDDGAIDDGVTGESATQTTPAGSTSSEPSASPSGTAPALVPTSSESGTEPSSSAPASPNQSDSPLLSNPSTPAGPTVDPVRKALEPVSNAVTTFGRVLNSVPGRLADLSTSTTPVRDVIAEVRDMLTTMYGAVTPLMAVPGNLYSLFGVPVPPAQPLIGTGGSFDGAKIEVPDEAPLFGPQPAQVAPAYVPTPGPLFGTLAPRPTLGKVATAPRTQPLTVSGIVPLKMDTPRTAQSLFQHVIEAVLVPASLTALAAVALPGIGALLVVSAAGVRLGYRQAKAALKMRTSGIARFAGPGPIGVVRSGSMIALRQRSRGPRTARAVCPEVAAQPASTEATVLTLERIA
ncbi:hypothetical protein [Mycolicibacterium phlei]|uniref:hypothetical protein n=1 Tax=Mycolicibacterium phlei TaxID=1771 RepID=UPI000F831A92|nr:hypothetical protein [Mycolicibacterium phlei]